MDRRQQKTRAAIFRAFNKLLEEITDSICKSIDMENSVNNLVDMDIPGKVSGSIIRQT